MPDVCWNRASSKSGQVALRRKSRALGHVSPNFQGPGASGKISFKQRLLTVSTRETWEGVGDKGKSEGGLGRETEASTRGVCTEILGHRVSRAFVNKGRSKAPAERRIL